MRNCEANGNSQKRKKKCNRYQKVECLHNKKTNTLHAISYLSLSRYDAPISLAAYASHA